MTRLGNHSIVEDIACQLWKPTLSKSRLRKPGLEDDSGSCFNATQITNTAKSFNYRIVEYRYTESGES